MSKITKIKAAVLNRWLVCLIILLGLGTSVVNATTYQIGSGTATNTQRPLYAYYGYNYSQSIYTVAELNAAGASGSQVITQIRYFYAVAGSTPANWASWTVYIGNTSQATLTSNTNWVAVGTMQQCFSGNISLPGAGNWMTITLTTPFTWNGTSNLVVAIDENTPNYDASSATAWRVYTGVGNRYMLYYSDPTNPNPASPPAANVAPSTIMPQIQFEMTGSSACSGTPAPGNTVLTSGGNPTCASASFTLGIQNTPSGSGVTYQWQSAPPPGTTYTNIGGATNALYTTTQATATYYRTVVTCAGNSGISNPLQITQGSAAACAVLCVGTANCAASDHITNVTFSTLNNNSGACLGSGGNSAYSDFRSTVAAPSVQQGQTVTFTVHVANGGTEHAAGWIDWNQNLIFDASEWVDLNTGTLGSDWTFTTTVVVPYSAVVGTTILRARSQYSTNITSGQACTSWTYGETEDYLINVTLAPACSGSPTPGNTVATPSAACSGANFTLSLQNTTTGSGVTYQWQTSPDGVTWANGAGASTSNTYVTSQTTATWYQALVTCAGNTTISNPLQVAMSSFVNCYCNPTYTTGTSGCFYGVISNVTLNTLNHNPPCLNSAPYVFVNPPAGAATTSLVPGQSYTLSITSGVYNGIGVWIDWNQSGTYDVSEYYSISGNNNSSGVSWTGTATVTVPMNAVSGLTGMRVSSAYYCCYPTPIANNLPCATWTYGETEDYRITTLPLPANPPNPTQVGPTTSCTLGNDLVVSGSAPSGETWYWQSSASGTSTAEPVSGPYHITGNGTYYVRSYNATYAIWSVGAGSVTVTDFPSGPAAPSLTSPANPACGSVTLVSGLTSASDEIAYWQGTNALGTSTGTQAADNTTATNYTATADGTYYLRNYNTTSGCWGTPVSAAVTIWALPTPPVLSASPTTVCPNSPVTLQAVAPSAPPTGYSVSSLSYASMPSPETTTLANAGPTGDEGTVVANIGFSFNYYGNIYTQVQVHTNGYIVFGSNNYVFGGYSPTGNIPTTTATNNWFGHWADMNASAGQISYATIGSAPNRKFIVNYNHDNYYSATPYYSGQLVVNEADGSMDIYITHMQTTYISAIGCENLAGTLGTAAPGHNNVAVATDNEAWHFAPIQAMGFLWSANTPGNGGIAPGNETLANTTGNPPSTTIYTMTLTDPAHSCQSSNTVTVTVMPTPPAPNVTGAATTCGSGSVTLTATGTGGTLNWYDAATGGNLVATGGSYTTPVISATTNYYVEEYNGTCSGPRAMVTATVTPAPATSVSSDVTFVCAGGTPGTPNTPNNNTANLSVTSGYAYTSYTWTSNPAGFNGSGANVSVTPSATTVYTVTASDGSCTNVNTITVTAGTVPNILSTTATPPTVCQGGTSQLIVAVQGAGGGTPPSGYCSPTMYPSNPCNWLDVVSTSGGLTNFSNATAAYNGTGATYFPSYTASQVLGGSFTLTLQAAGTCSISYQYIWIDWNANGIFEASEMVSGTGANVGNTPTAYTINIPVNATPGVTRMRTMSRGIGSPNPATACDNESAYYGEVEDYNLDITGGGTYNYLWTGAGLSSTTIFNPVATLGSPSETYNVTVTDPLGCYAYGSVTLSEPTSNPGNTISTLANTCPSQSFTLSTQNNPPGASYQWQSSPDNVTWANISGATSPTYTTTQTAATYYRAQVGCPSGSNFTTPLLVGVNNFVNCYCIPTTTNGCLASDHITNVAINTLNNNTGVCLNASYSDYKYLSPTNLLVSTPYTLTVHVANGGTEYAGAWIDYDHSGTFDVSEYISLTGTLGTDWTFTGTVNVPVSAMGGNTAMRVRSSYAATVASNSACATYSYGETEDYLVNLGDPNCIAAPTFPLNAGSACPVGLALSWPSLTAATGYDVYLDGSTGTTLVSANQAGTSYTPPVQLASGSAYYWKVIPQFSTGSCTTPQTWSFNVLSPPEPTASSNSPICEGASLSLTSDNNATGQSTSNSFSWTGPNSFISAQQNPSVTGAATAAHAGTYTVVVTNQFLCTASYPISVTVNANPSLSVASVTGVSCVGLCDGYVAFSPTGGTGAGTYLLIDDLFNFSGNDTIFNYCETGSAGNPSPNTAYVTDGNGCNSSNVTYSIGHISVAPPAASVLVPPINNLPASACNGTVVSNINVPAVSAATQYIWDGPTGTTFNGSANPYTSATPSANITFGNPNGSGYYIGIQAANGCGTSTRKVQWVRGTTGVPAAISGVLTACPNSSENYSTTAVTGATSYLWTITGDATVSGTGLTSTVNFGPSFTTGTLCVAAQTSCYTSPAKCITISRFAPVVPAFIGTFTACIGQTLTYSVPAQAGVASYQWTLPPNTTGSSTTNSINVTFNAGFFGGDITVRAVSICGDLSGPRTRTIVWGVPLVPAFITGPLTGLCNQTIVYSCPAQAGTTFTWTVPAGATINSGQGSNAISVTFGVFTTSTVCVSTSNACGASAQRCITVTGRPLTPGAITATPSAWCANTSGIQFDVNVSALTGSYTLSWLYPGPSVATYVLGGGNSTQLTLDWISGSGQVQVTASNACGNQTRTSTQANSCREGEEVIANSNSTITIYPNPTSEYVNIEFNSIVKGNANVSVMDISGRIVASQSISVIEGLNKTQLDVSSIAKGIYMLNVNSEQGKMQTKIVVE